MKMEEDIKAESIIIAATVMTYTSTTSQPTREFMRGTMTHNIMRSQHLGITIS